MLMSLMTMIKMPRLIMILQKKKNQMMLIMLMIMPKMIMMLMLIIMIIMLLWLLTVYVLHFQKYMRNFCSLTLMLIVFEMRVYYKHRYTEHLTHTHTLAVMCT